MSERVNQKFGYTKQDDTYFVGIEKNGSIRSTFKIERNVKNPLGVAIGLCKILNNQRDYILPI